MDQNPYEPGTAELEDNEAKKSGGLLSIFKKVLIGFWYCIWTNSYPSCLGWHYDIKNV